jgi:hypothetical protein
VANAARGFSIVKRLSQVALAAGVCLMLQGQEARGQAWGPSTNPVYLNDNLSNVGIGTNSPQKTLHLYQAQKVPFIGDPNPTSCNSDIPTIRFSSIDAFSTTPGNLCPDINPFRINWDIQAEANALSFKRENITRMILTGNGFLGINTSNPNALLSLGSAANNTKLAYIS